MYCPILDQRQLTVMMACFRRIIPFCTCLWVTTSLMACETGISKDGLVQHESISLRPEITASSAVLQTFDANAQGKDARRQPQFSLVSLNSVLDDTVKTRLINLGARDDLRGLKFLKEVPTFLSEQHRVDADAHSFLHNLSEILLLDSRRTVLIEGFSDGLEDEKENQILSETSSGALRSALVRMGIDGRRISSRGYGCAYNLGGSVSLFSAGQHNRLEIFISDSSGIIPSRYLLKPD